MNDGSKEAKDETTTVHHGPTLWLILDFCEDAYISKITKMTQERCMRDERQNTKHRIRK